MDRLRRLLEAGIALSSELSLDALLQRVVDTAAELTEARYAALGVIDRSGQNLERFLTTGIDEETHAAIGDLPRGRGILGVLIHDAQPLRLADIADDPRSVGFPPHHPPMGTFLGVPVLLRGVAYGNLYLAEKAGGGEFTEEDQELTQVLALGARRLRERVAARIVLSALPEPDGRLRIAAAEGEGANGLVGMELERHASKAGRILERRRSERIDSVLEDPEVEQQAARRLGIHTGLYIPLVARGHGIGVVVAHDKEGADPRFTDDDLRLAETLAARAAIAVDLSERVSRDTVRRVVDAQELERKRLARELHDETGQALTSILLGLKPLEQLASTEEERAAVTSVRELVVSTLQDVRRLAVELRPTALDDFGLAAALERLAEGFREQTGIEVDIAAQLGDGRLPEEVETTLYRIVQEALTNVIKHAEASRVSILLTRANGAVIAVVEDDGGGFDPADARDGGLGLLGMRERLALLGGTLRIEAGAHHGTTVAAEVPLR